MSKHGQAVEGHPNLQYWGPNDFIRVRIRIDDPQVRKIIGKTELVKGLGTQSVVEAVRRSRIPLADFEAKIAEAMLSIGKTTPRTIIYMQTPRTTSAFAQMLVGARNSSHEPVELRITDNPASWPKDDAIPLAGFTYDAGIDLWAASRGTDNLPAPESVDVYRGHLRRFMAYVGSDDMGDATDQHVIDYPQVLQTGSDGKRRLGNKSVNNNMASIRRVFRVAAQHKKIATDPTRGVAGASNVHKLKVRKNPLKDRKSFDRDQHAQIIAGALAVPKDDPRRWLWLLGAIYGARIAEFAEAKVSAIRTVHGRLCFDISEEHRNLWGGVPISLKTESSPRVLPLHSKLIEWGFLEYVETRRETSGDDASLFPTIPVNRYGKRAHDASRQCNAWLRDELGIRDRRLVFHSTRHTVKTFLRGRVEEDVSNAITGHDDGTVAGDYGETELTVMAEAIEAHIPIAAA
jgi:integrase